MCRILPIYGGQDINRQIRALKKHPHIIVGTPGRILDHINRKTLRLQNVETVVLDEADEMLNMGFIEDIEAILTDVPDTHQTLLFSAIPFTKCMPAVIFTLCARRSDNRSDDQSEKDPAINYAILPPHHHGTERLWLLWH